MNKLTGQEILEKLDTLQEYDIVTVEDFYNYGLNLDVYEYAEKLDDEEAAEVKEILASLGETENVASDTPDSEWDYYSRVVNYFRAHDVYIETKAHYTSYVGTEFEDGFGTEVKPKQKMFTVYEEVK